MFKKMLAAASMAAALVAAPAWAEMAPDALIKQVTSEVMEQVKGDKAIQGGDLKKVTALVDQKILPHLNFQRMTASAAGPAWRQASPEQQQRLQDEFKTLLVRTYAGALAQVRDQTLELKPMRAAPTDAEVVVRSVIKGGGAEPIALDYRMEKNGDAWKIYDVNVSGVWLVENYKSTFKQEISAGGIDGLIKKLADKNKAAASAKG